MSESDPPDFATLRAVEILAEIYERRMKAPNVPPPPIDTPILLFNEAIPLHVGVTTRAQAEHALGVGFVYPTAGWYTHAIAADGPRFLSLFFRGKEHDPEQRLAGVEYYVPRAENAPRLRPRTLGAFRLVPGEVTVGMALTSVREPFVPAVGGPAPIVFETVYEARFPGGVAYVMGNGGTIERLVLYPQA